MDTVLTVAFGVIGLGVMILVHESGHFLAARAAGVHVEIFSIGWGRRLAGVQRGGTWYQLSWFPFGGYCKMRGDEVLRGAAGDDWTQAMTEPGAFFAASSWRRIAIVAAGPLANLAFAVLVLTVVAWTGFTIRSPDNRIVVPIDRDSPAMDAGLRTGDRIVSIDGQRVRSFQDIIREVSPAPERELRITVERGGRVLVAAVTPALDAESQTGRIGVYAWIDPVIGAIEDGTVEDGAVEDGAAGVGSSRLAVGDRIVAVDGVAVAHTVDLHEALRRSGSPVELTVERNGRPFTVRQAWAVRSGGVELAGARLLIPVIRYREPAPVPALGAALREVGRTVRATIEGIGRLFSGGMRDAVAGPLRLTYYMGAVATGGLQNGLAAGITDFLRFLSVISVVLFLMNLLPIPALDGGHIVLYGVELILGRRVKPAVVYRIQTIGVSVLILVALSVTLSDILFLAGQR